MHPLFKEIHVTYLQQVNKLPGHRAPLEKLLNSSQQPKVKDLVDKARAAGKGSDNYKKYKEQLPAVVVGGTFVGDYPKNGNLEHSSGLLTIDIDNITGPDLDKALEVLQSNQHIILTQKSVSGQGCWGILWYDTSTVDPDGLWQFIYDSLLTKGIEIDKQCKDVYTRRRFICSDAYWINPNPVMFDKKLPGKYLKKPAQANTQRTRGKVSVSPANNIQAGNGPCWHFGGGDNEYDGVPTIKKLASYLWLLLGEEAYETVRKDIFSYIPYIDLEHNKDIAKRLLGFAGSFKNGKVYAVRDREKEWLDKHILPLINIRNNTNTQAVTLDTRYLSDSKAFKNTFDKYLNDNQIFILEAPTGTGKTRFIGKYAKENKGLVLTHTRSLRANYISELNLIENPDEDPSAAVMTYDRFVMNYSNVTGKVIFIDEAHELFNTGGYREKPWVLLGMLDELAKNNKIVLVSATPGYLNGKYVKLLVNTPVKTFIPVNVLHFNHDARRNYLKGVLEKVTPTQKNKIIVYTDEYARLLMNKLDPQDKEFVELHHSEICRDYKEHELIIKPAALCTSLVCNGINFDNEDPVKIFIPIDNRTTAEKIIQFVGRFRKSKSISLYLLNFYGYFDPKTIDYLETKWRVEDYDCTEKITEEYLREFTEKNTEYLEAHGGWEKILKELPGEFVIVKEQDREAEESGRGNSREPEMLRDKLNGVEKTYTEDEDITYQKVLGYLEDIITIWRNRDLSANIFLNILGNQNINDEPTALWNFCKTHLVSPRGLRDKLRIALRYIDINDKKFKEIESFYEKEMKQTNDKDILGMLDKKLKEKRKLFEKYSGKSVEEIFDIVLQDLQDTSNKRSKAGSNGNKKGKAKGGSKGGSKGVEIEINGKKYPTKKAAREALDITKYELDKILKEIK